LRRRSGRASDSTTIGVFAQDQWTIRKLTLNLGLRYDSFNATAKAQEFARVISSALAAFPR
jgi:outer membrane receptor protein involved in Fe transport